MATTLDGLPVFHPVHGDNVRLSSDSRLATRERGFDCGLCALSSPLSDTSPDTPAAAASAPSPTATAPNSRVQLLVRQTNPKWTGSLGVGVSPSAPSRDTLPQNAASAAQGWAFAQLEPGALVEGTLLTVWLDAVSHALCYESSATGGGSSAAVDADVDGAQKNGEVLLDDPEILDCLDAKQPLWFYLDIYGYVTQVQILAPGEAADLRAGIPLSLSIPGDYAKTAWSDEAFTDEALVVGSGGADDDTLFVKEAYVPGGLQDVQFVPESRKSKGRGRGPQSGRGGPQYQSLPMSARSEQERARDIADFEESKRKKQEELAAKKRAAILEREKAKTKISAVKINGLLIRVTQGDICDETTDALVNSTNVMLDLKGQVSGALCKKAGPKLAQECAAQKKMVNDVFVSGAYDLNQFGVKWIVHVRAPNDEADCEKVIKNGLAAAGQKGANSVAIPMIGAGMHGKNPMEMTRAIVRACGQFAQEQGTPRKIKSIDLVGYSDEGYSVFLDEQTCVAQTLPRNCVCRGLYEQYPLIPDTDEYKKVAKKFTDAKLKDVELVKIMKIKAPHLEKKFAAHKFQLHNQYFAQDEILDALEREVYHGTQQMFTTKVLAGGFNPKFGSQDAKRTWYGQGCYFARDLSYSAKDKFSVPNVEKHKFVFVVRLLVGATFSAREHHNPKLDKILTKPPENPDSVDHYHYDTAIACDCGLQQCTHPLDNPGIFISFHTDQALPTYLLVLKKK